MYGRSWSWFASFLTTVSSLVQCVTLADRRLQVLEGTDFLSWEPYKLPGDFPIKQVADRWRLHPRPIPKCGTQQMLSDLKADTSNECFLPDRLEDLYEFYLDKIKQDVAVEKMMARCLDRVPLLAASSDCWSVR